ncbi:MAG: FAD-binding protein [Chloroflexi bacterium]|nr:FAD-binding protein [Chloroflexota bacterium]
MTAATVSPQLVRELERIVGRDGVFHRPEDLLVFEYDGTIDRGYPAVVVYPRSAEQVAAIVRVAVLNNLPLVPRGAGTGLSGGALATEGGILMPLTRMNSILELDLENRIAVVEPGLVNLELSRAVAKHGLFYAPDPSSQKACTIGGNVAENAGGPHCLALGVTTNHVLGLELVLANGEIVRVGGWGRDRPGYDLTGVMVGSEGTLAVVTKVCVRLLRKPEAVRTFLAIFDTIDQATGAVAAVIGAGIVPGALEMIDKYVIRAVEPTLHCGFPLDAEAVLLVEVDGLREFVRECAASVGAIMREAGAREVRSADDPAEREQLWVGRKGAIGALGALAPNYYILDGVVPPSMLPEVLTRVYEICERYGFIVGNVFHAGDGNLHPNIVFDERVPGATAKVLDAGGEVLRVCVEAGGSITGEHGVGVEKRDYMSLIFSEADMAAMAKLKRAFGAGERFNPCKAFPTHKGCGEVHRGPAVAALGPDIYV